MQKMGELNENREVVKKNKKWIIPAIIGVVLIATIIVAVIVVISATAPSHDLKKQLNLGNKYLADLDYENALLAYKEALSINPKSKEAATGLLNSYIGLIDYYMNNGDYEKALALVQEGLELLPDGNAELQSRIDKIHVLLTQAKELEDMKYEEEPISPNITLAVGDPFEFGHYEQDGNEGNGLEPIQWHVFGIKGNRVIFLSDYVLDAQPLNSENTSVTWETCTLRAWLNGDCYNQAFSEEEKKQIADTSLENKNHSYWKTNAGNDTSDKIFILSEDEIRKYMVFDYQDKDGKWGLCEQLIAEPTNYAIEKGCENSIITADWLIDRFEGIPDSYISRVSNRKASCYWSRTPGSAEDSFIYFANNAITLSSASVSYEKIGVRPVFCIEY